MVKLVTRICAFMIGLAFLISWLHSCEGNPFDRFLDDLFDPTESVKDKNYISDDDIKNADPNQLNIYVNIRLSEINQQYVVCNSTNISLTEEIKPIYVQLNQCNSSITTQNNYISKSNINQNTLINWATDNRSYITTLERSQQSLVDKINDLTIKIKELDKQIKSLKNAIKSNNCKCDTEEEREKYNALKLELNDRLEKLTNQIKKLSAELRSNNSEIERIKDKIDDCIKELEKLNKKIDKLIETSETSSVSQQDTNYYYIVGTEDDLKLKGVIYSDDLSGALKIQPNLDNKYFAILTDKNRTVTLGKETDEFKILSDIPGSYDVKYINGKKVLVINDVKTFWSKTKYLIIVKSSTKSK